MRRISTVRITVLLFKLKLFEIIAGMFEIFEVSFRTVQNRTVAVQTVVTFC
jgi:hypothetical protein